MKLIVMDQMFILQQLLEVHQIYIHGMKVNLSMEIRIVISGG